MKASFAKGQEGNLGIELEPQTTDEQLLLEIFAKYTGEYEWRFHGFEHNGSGRELRRDLTQIRGSLFKRVVVAPDPAFVPVGPVCVTCQDTHVMPLGGQAVNCTRCPTPCQDCRQGGNGPYCEKTPCPCCCHALKPKKVQSSARVVEELLEPEILRIIRDLFALGHRPERRYTEPLPEEQAAMDAWDATYNALHARAKQLGLIE